MVAETNSQPTSQTMLSYSSGGQVYVPSALPSPHPDRS